MSNAKDSVSHQFFKPLHEAITKVSSLRICPSLSDEVWLETGIRRVLSSCRSGRDFLSQVAFSGLTDITRSHFFETLKSRRRLQLCQDTARVVHDDLASKAPDRLASVNSLDGFEIFAGDGHFHVAASHDVKKNGKKYAIGHFYGLDLRCNALFHLQMADAENKLKEHDMSALKRTEIEELRRNAPKGQKVLWVWDRAGIDFQQYYRWKKGSGIYFLSHAKENMRPETLAEYVWDKTESVNHGVVSDREVSTSQGVSIRQVIYIDPATATEFTFITNLPTKIAPGVVAQLYRMRWDVEKVFDELENKLGEKKGWASSPNAKAMQAAFLCMAHNLIEATSLRLEQNHGISNDAEIDRKSKVLAKVRKDSEAPLPKLYLTLQRFTQHSVKLIRWLRYHLWNDSCLDAGRPLRQIMTRNFRHRSQEGNGDSFKVRKLLFV